MNLVRFLLSAILMGFPIVVLCVAMLKTDTYRTRREGVRIIVASLFVAAVSSVWGAFIASLVREYPTKSIFNSTILQMDIPRVVTALTDFWSGAGAGTSIHPFVPLLFQPISYLVARTTGLDSEFRVAQITSILCLSLSTSLLFVAVYSYVRKWSVAILVVLGYTVSFGFLLLSSFPESSGLATFTTVLPYAIYAVHRNSEFSTREKVLYLFAGLISFGITVTNVVHALIVYWVRSRQSHAQAGFLTATKSTMLYLLCLLFVSVALSLIQVHLLYEGSAPWYLPGGIVSQGACLALWWDGWLHPLRVLVQVMVYAVVAPSLRLSDLGFMLEGAPLVQISAEASGVSETPLQSLVVMVVFSLFLLFTSLRAGRTKHSLPVFMGLAFNLFLHSVYGNDLLLYVGYWLPLLWLLIALGTDTPRRVWGLSIVVLLIAYQNHWGWSKMRAQLDNASAYATLQAPFGLPLEHEFRRTFIDWSGTFSPGIGSNGILLITYDVARGENNLKSLSEQDNVLHTMSNGCPVIRSHAGNVSIEQRWFPLKDGVLTSLTLRLIDGSPDAVLTRVYMLVKPEGPAGSDFERSYEWVADNNLLVANGVPFIRCAEPPSFVLYHEKPHRLFEVAVTGDTKFPRTLKNMLRSLRGGSPLSRKNALLCWEITIRQGEERKLWFHCLYSLPAVNQQGKDLYKLAKLPEYRPIQAVSKSLSTQEAVELSRQSVQFWHTMRKKCYVSLPDAYWEAGFWGGTGHLIQSVQQDGRIPVTPINYGVFVRDAVYMIYALIVAGQFDYARQAIDYLLAHPWEGRPYPEGDAPGHLLWIMHKYWSFTRDRTWLKQKLPAIRSVAKAILEMRSDGTHSVEVDLLGQKRTIPASPKVAERLREKARRGSSFRLNYGTMDQGGLLYVNLVSLAGLQGAIGMMDTLAPEEASELRPAFQDYLREFTDLLQVIGYDLSHDQRGYCFATWPGQLHVVIPEIRRYFAQAEFNGQRPTSVWKYLDMDHAHNFLLAGERSAGYRVVERYLNLYSFRTWKLFDEGGPSSEGYWKELSNWRWNREVAIPHGWSLASLILLMRDALVYEESGALVLLSGVPPEWFVPGKKLSYRLPTEHGVLRAKMECEGEHILLEVNLPQAPPKGIYLALPDSDGERRVHVKLGRNIIPRRR